jgi:hypothetical protein
MLAWRNELFDAVKTPNLKAIIAFGSQAQKAVDLWPGRAGLQVFKVPHPSSRDAAKLLQRWGSLVTDMRAQITPDPDGSQAGPNYGTKFTEADYVRIPMRDLPFGMPQWLGDDSWGRKAHPKHNNSVSRPTPDDRHTLIWIAPKSS